MNKNLNVLLVGKHGVGKTTIVKEAWDRSGLVLDKSYKIFSGATLDPWTDFVGVPKRVVGDDGVEYLDYIRPKHMNGDLQAIFMDEFNRAKPKVRNALMELIQFKSINGKKFPNLKFIWAAVNPDDDDTMNYDVDELDPAQRDRFQVIVQIPYEPDKRYFSKKFGAHMATQSVAWWNTLDDDTKDVVSPRRLDYTLDYSIIGGDIADILPVSANVKALKDLLKQDPYEAEFRVAFSTNKTNTLSKLLNTENSWNSLEKLLVNDVTYYPTLANLLNEERLSQLIGVNGKFFDWGHTNIDAYTRIKDIMESIFDSLDVDAAKKYDVDKLKRLKELFSYKLDEYSGVFVRNENGAFLDSVDGHKGGDDVDYLENKLDDYFKLKNNSKLQKGSTFFGNYFNKMVGSMVPSDKLTKDICMKTLNFIDFLASTNAPNTFFTKFKGIVEYANTIIDWLATNNALTNAHYFYDLRNFKKVLESNKSQLNKFILILKDELEDGDVPLISNTEQ